LEDIVREQGPLCGGLDSDLMIVERTIKTQKYLKDGLDNICSILHLNIKKMILCNIILITICRV